VRPVRLYLRRTGIDELPSGLVERLQRAQPEARADFFRRYAPQVRRILYLQGFCEEVDDAVQEVFIKVFRARLPQQEVFLGWFYRVILNTGRDLGRRRKTRFGLVDRVARVAPARVAEDEPRAADPALRAALAALPVEFRETVALRFFADMALEEIALTQQVPLGTVKSRLHSAMARLRTALTTDGRHAVRTGLTDERRT
jgi:RNA polymerase sigma factor (sigma-70 family)